MALRHPYEFCDMKSNTRKIIFFGIVMVAGIAGLCVCSVLLPDLTIENTVACLPAFAVSLFGMFGLRKAVKKALPKRENNFPMFL